MKNVFLLSFLLFSISGYAADCPNFTGLFQRWSDGNSGYLDWYEFNQTDCSKIKYSFRTTSITYGAGGPTDGLFRRTARPISHIAFASYLMTKDALVSTEVHPDIENDGKEPYSMRVIFRLDENNNLIVEEIGHEAKSHSTDEPFYSQTAVYERQ